MQTKQSHIITISKQNSVECLNTSSIQTGEYEPFSKERHMSSSLPSPSMGSLLTATLPIEAHYTLQRSMPKTSPQLLLPVFV